MTYEPFSIELKELSWLVWRIPQDLGCWRTSKKRLELLALPNAQNTKSIVSVVLSILPELNTAPRPNAGNELSSRIRAAIRSSLQAQLVI
jgi:hypothetical protein